MSESLDRVLIPIDVSDSVSRYEIVTGIFHSSEVMLLGYWSVPDQSASDQLRDQFEAEAQQRLETIAGQFADEDIPVQTRLVFTKDRDQLIDRAVNEYGCESVLIPGATKPPSERTRGLVLVKPDADLNRIADTLGALFADSDVELLLFHAAESENEHLYDATQYMLRGLADRLVELGVESDRIKWEQSTEGEHLDAVLSRAPEFDFYVLGESEPSLRERIFGSVQATLAQKTAKPQLTIRTGV